MAQSLSGALWFEFRVNKTHMGCKKQCDNLVKKMKCKKTCGLCEPLPPSAPPLAPLPDVYCRRLSDKKTCKTKIKKCEKKPPKSMDKCKKKCKKDAKREPPLCQKTCCKLGFPVQTDLWRHSCGQPQYAILRAHSDSVVLVRETKTGLYGGCLPRARRSPTRVRQALRPTPT